MSFDTADGARRAYIALDPKNSAIAFALTAPQHQLLYLSHLVASVRYDVFAAICQVSRRNNAERQIAGVLLFDGHRFCQLLDGPAASIALTRQSIERDPRHEFMTVLVDRPSAALAKPEPWQAGYCGPDDLDQLVGPERLGADAALAVFRSIVSRADLSP
jgi:Sensors of blue-light using FAD